MNRYGKKRIPLTGSCFQLELFRCASTISNARFLIFQYNINSLKESIFKIIFFWCNLFLTYAILFEDIRLLLKTISNTRNFLLNLYKMFCKITLWDSQYMVIYYFFIDLTPLKSPFLFMLPSLSFPWLVFSFGIVLSPKHLSFKCLSMSYCFEESIF